MNILDSRCKICVKNCKDKNIVTSCSAFRLDAKKEVNKWLKKE